MVSSFLVLNHYFLINFNYVVSAVLQTQPFQSRLLATWNYTQWSSECNTSRRFWNILNGCLAIAMEFGVARDISKQALYLDKQGERSELWRKQKVNNISCKFLANFTFRKAININQYIQLATRAPSTGRRIGDFHCNFSCQKFFFSPWWPK